ncbi:MAG: phosphotransferase enzyme family protein [Gammaproteobacteria bacterium]
MSTDFYNLTPEQQGEVMQQFAADAIRPWGREIQSLQLIKMRENAVFKLTTTEQEHYALRIHRYGYHSDTALRSEIQWTRALSQAGVSVPTLVPTVAGDHFTVVESPHLPEPRQIDLYAWIDGEPLGSVEAGLCDAAEAEQVFHTVGRLAAQVHNQATNWALPDGFERHAWDVAGLTGAQPFWGRFWELQALNKAQRQLLLKARDQVAADLTAYGKPAQTYSLIHADLTPENIMLAGDELTLIDFDDAGFGWHQFELVTALFFLRGQNYFAAASAALIAGYRTERELSEQTLTTLPMFYVARAFTYLGWVHTRHETETARELTPMLVETACELVEEYLDAA